MMYNLILHDMLACIETDTLVAFSKVNSENSLRVEFCNGLNFSNNVFVMIRPTTITVSRWNRLIHLEQSILDVADPQVFEKVKSMIECFLNKS